MPAATSTPLPPPDNYDRNAIFALNGPIHPPFVTEAVRTLLRTLPLETNEPQTWIHRRISAALSAFSALHPRDEIEVMLGVQAVAAYHAAAATWYLGMNHHHPRGDSTRHLNAAASAARTFDTLLKAMERRQARPLAVPPGRPPCRDWPEDDLSGLVAILAERADPAAAAAGPGCDTPANDTPADAGGAHDRAANDRAANDDEANPPYWSADAVRLAEEQRALETLADDYAGLDLNNTPGIRPDGSIVVVADPTPAQHAYMIRRYALNLRKEHQENLRSGRNQLPKIKPIRIGDVIP